MRSLAFTVVACVVMVGCSDAFDPTATGPRPFVVFALLNSSLDTQIVRVQATSPPTEKNPPLLPVPGTVVTLRGNFAPAVIGEPILLRPDPASPDTTSIAAFRLPIRPSRGESYFLEVQTPHGTATGSIVVPGIADLSTTDFLILQHPYDYPVERLLSFSTLLSNQTLGYVIRVAIEYDVLRNGVWTTETRDIPVAYTTLTSSTEYTAVYPSLTRRSAPAPTSIRGFVPRESMFYSNSVYRQTLKILYDVNGETNLRMRRFLIMLVQADVPFFMSYSFANNFQDRYTIRVDQPDYSNMTGALGFFGSMTIDTLSYPLPVSLRPR